MKLNCVYALNSEGKRALLGYEMLAENEQEVNDMNWIRDYLFDGGVNVSPEYAGRSSVEGSDDTNGLMFEIPTNARRLAIGKLNECEEGNGKKLTARLIVAMDKGNFDCVHRYYNANNLSENFALHLHERKTFDCWIGRAFKYGEDYVQVDRTIWDDTLRKFFATGELAECHKSDSKEYGKTDECAWIVDRYGDWHVIVSNHCYSLSYLK